MSVYSIYRIVCFPTGKVYVGMTDNPKRRHREHFVNLRANRHHNKYLQRAYNLLGANRFYFEILESYLAESEVQEREKYWISFFDSYRNGFNLTGGGESGEGIGKPCEWNGVNYPSQTACAKANGMTTGLMCHHLSTGKKSNEEISPVRKPIIWNGVSYESIASASRALDMSESALSRWLLLGYKSDIDLWNDREKKVYWKFPVELYTDNRDENLAWNVVKNWKRVFQTKKHLKRVVFNDAMCEVVETIVANGGQIPDLKKIKLDTPRAYILLIAYQNIDKYW